MIKLEDKERICTCTCGCINFNITVKPHGHGQKLTRMICINCNKEFKESENFKP